MPRFLERGGLLPTLRPQGYQQYWIILNAEFESLALQND